MGAANQELVELLEDILKDAKSGIITGFGFVYGINSRAVVSGWDDTGAGAFEMVGMLEHLKSEYYVSKIEQ
ncbi:hypothetical protein [Hahella ganghwensis]|uniref:hypothetical protein n=1 Tax=Hahella ganghwensis TaxID=286420 RepID=UPI00037E0B4A|nr:hypothetical protein [Hahella ganghwensis]